MAELQMHENDRSTLERLLQIPMRMTKIPPKVEDLYFKAQRAQHNVSLGGNLSFDILMSICLIADAIELPKATPTKFGHLKEGHPLFFKANDWEWVPCTFIKVENALTHIYMVHLYGEDHQVAERDLRLEHPSDAPLAEAAATEAKVAEEKSSVDLVERLKIEWPIGKLVDVAAPGEEYWTGNIRAHGSGQFAGRVQVLPLGASKTKYKWVAFADLSEAEQPPAAAIVEEQPSLTE